MRIDNLSAVVKAIRERAGRYGDARCVVGYTMSYGVYVHENLEAHHAPPTRAKFLEEPSRTHRAIIAEVIRGALRRGATLAQALLLGGLRLQRESQLIVPVATGALRASAFVEVEK